jgi:hypothetical protein
MGGEGGEGMSWVASCCADERWINSSPGDVSTQRLGPAPGDPGRWRWRSPPRRSDRETDKDKDKAEPWIPDKAEQGGLPPIYNILKLAQILRCVATDCTPIPATVPIVKFVYEGSV